MLMAEAVSYPRLRAPQEDGRPLVYPPRASLPGVVDRNRRHLAQLQYDVQGRSLDELVTSARRRLVELAVAYTGAYRDLSWHSRLEKRADAPVILSGHQPQLFHAGVWYKNFVLGDLAKEVSGVGIHLLIDSDLCRNASIRVPTGSLEAPLVESVPFDQPAADVPYEERTVRDEAVFNGFSGRVTELLEPFVARPLVESLWPLVLSRSGSERNLGLRVAQGRHLLEAEMGNATLELPQSAVCTLGEFHWFVAHLLAHLPRFWAAYNDSLAAYRQAHGLRNRAHPVPDLAQNDGFLEAPFWMWTSDDPRRKAVFARQLGDELEITDGSQQTVTLALSADRDADIAAEQLAEAAARGLKLRTRALATTLFARLVLSDLFLHGIGGARYDQVTDDIARRFFGFALPEFATASATLRLPIRRAHSVNGQLRDVRRQLRELAYHPERFVPTSDPAAARIIADKTRWLHVEKNSGDGRQRHLGITAANAALQPFVAARRTEFEQRRQEIERLAAVNSILDSREYAFCLFPRAQFERLISNSAAS